MKLIDFWEGTKEFVHTLLPNLGQWEEELTLSLVKQVKYRCASLTKRNEDASEVHFPESQDDIW